MVDYLLRRGRQSPFPQQIVVDWRLNLGEFPLQCWEAFRIIRGLRLRVHVIEFVELPLAPFVCIGHRAEYKSAQIRNSSSRIGKIQALLAFNFKAVLEDALICLLPCLASGVFEDGPKVRYTEDSIGSLKGFC